MYIDQISTSEIEIADLSKDNLTVEDNEMGEFSVFRELKNKLTLINFIVTIICFVVVSFNYYMISFYMKYVGGNIFINTALSTISEGIGNFAAGGLQKSFGTKRSFVI